MEQMEHSDLPLSREEGGIMATAKSKFQSLQDKICRFDEAVSSSTFGRIFRLRESGHPMEVPNATFLKEVRAGITTFATMAYIVAVNAAILSQTGGTCLCSEEKPSLCKRNEAYAACKEEVRRDLITATAAVAGFSSFVFGFLTNLPVALAPGMGLNAYFAFQVVGPDGSGKIPYRLALTAVFVEGLIFIFLALTGLRQWLVKLIPATIKTATGVGIGLFLTIIGLSYSAGIGAITGGGTATPLALGGCRAEHLDEETGICQGSLMSNPKMWLGIFGGGILTAFLMAFRVKYALILGIAFVSVLSWPRGTPVTFFPDTEQGNSRFDFFSKIVQFHPIKHTLGQLDWDIRDNEAQFALALFTFLYVDIIDATATLYSMVRFCGVVNPRDGDFPRSTLAYCADASCISFASLLGCSPVTAFIESGAGIAEGGRSGLTAMVTGLCFLASIFFAPIFASIPPWATGCTLILVGSMMIRQVQQINWHYIGDVIPSFVVIAFIPFSYSVAYGLIAGLVVYASLNSLIRLVVWVSGGRIEPREYDLKEYWTWKGPGKKPWFARVMQKKGYFNRGDSDSQSKRGFTLADGASSSEHSRHHPLGDKDASQVAVPPPAMTLKLTRH